MLFAAWKDHDIFSPQTSRTFFLRLKAFDLKNSGFLLHYQPHSLIVIRQDLANREVLTRL